jgi:hypothetical protein
MPTDSGWVTKEKRDDRKVEHVTLSPIGQDKVALDTAIKGTVYNSGSDAVEAGTTDTILNATGHAAKKGDLIRMTSGATSGEEQYVFEVAANTITLEDSLSAAPSATDAFDILKPVTLTLGSDGGITLSPFDLQFERDGSSQKVIEDTVTPANNVPLPVKLSSITGDINITANDLNVQLSHNAANPDSTQIGDGTEIMAINASNEAQVADDTARASLASIDADTTTIAGDTTSLDTKIDVNLSTVATEVTMAAAEAHLGNIDTATASIDTDIDVALSTRASEATLSDAEAHLGTIDTNTGTIAGDTTSLDTKIDVNLSTVATEVTAAAILADTANIDTNITTLAGWDTGSGSVTANTQRVELTTESLAALENVTVTIDPLTVVDTTYTDASSSNIPGNAAAPLQLIGSTPSDIKKIQVADTTGAFLEIMTGAAASETRVALVGPGSDQTLELDITSGTRVSVRRVDDAAAISVGSLAINYIG